jgi:hypothetical protein
MQRLKDLGFQPELRQSETLGQTIRLKGEDFLKLHQMRNEVIGQAKWEGAAAGGGMISRVATNEMSPESIKALRNALEAKDIKTYDHNSSTLGPTIRVTGEDVPKVMKLHEQHKDAAPPAPVPVPPPLPPAAPPAANGPQQHAGAPPVEPPPLAATSQPPTPPAGNQPPPAASHPPVPEGVQAGAKPPSPPPPAQPPPAVPPEVKPVMAGVVAEESSRFAPGLPGHVRLQQGVAAFGIAQSAMGLYDAAKTGDKVEAAISGVNLLTSTASTLEPALPALKGAGKFVPGLNVVTTLADGAYQISKEDTVQHKEERAVAVGTTAAVGIGLGTATATAAEGAALTGALGAGGAAVVTVAAPVVLTGVAVYATAKTGEAVIENKRAWDGLDRQIEESGQAHRRNVATPNADGKPSIIQFGHIVGALSEVSPDMKDAALSTPLQRDARGRMKIDQMRGYDMSDPKNLKEFERALDAKIALDEKIAKDNSSMLPRWLRFSDSLLKEEDARMDLAPLKAARAELDMYKKDLADHAAAQPQPADKSKFAGATKAPPAATPKDPAKPEGTPVSLVRPPRRPSAAAPAS